MQRIDHESAQGCWTLWRRQPPPALQPYVAEIQGYVETGGRPVVRDELPSGILPLIIVLGPGFTLENGEGPGTRRPLPRSFVAGLHRRFATVGSFGEALCLQVDFTPPGARRFLRCEPGDLADRVVDLAEIARPVAEALEGRLAAAPSWEVRFRLLEAFLAERLLTAPAGDWRVEAAWRRLVASDGGAPIGRLAVELGISRKHLAQLFARQIGQTPKAFARVLRFERAFAALGAGESDLADLALRCGYADQAHFNRDFKAFAGESPTQLLRRLLPDGSGLMAELR